MRHATAAEPQRPDSGYYTWRDPAKYTPRQLADMAAHDARYAGDENRPRLASGQAIRQRAAERRARFAELRAAGVPVEQAAEVIGVGVKYARRMEQARIRKGAE